MTAEAIWRRGGAKAGVRFVRAKHLSGGKVTRVSVWAVRPPAQFRSTGVEFWEEIMPLVKAFHSRGACAPVLKIAASQWRLSGNSIPGLELWVESGSHCSRPSPGASPQGGQPGLHVTQEGVTCTPTASNQRGVVQSQPARV